jgi:hypothetical protein
VSFYRKPHYGTWLHPASKKQHQLDHIIVQQGERRRFTDAGCRAQLISSDHQAVSCRLRIAMALARKPTDARGKLTQLDYAELYGPRAKACFARSVVQRVQAAGDFLTRPYEALADAVQAAALERLPKQTRASPGWYTARAAKMQPLIDTRVRLFTTQLHQPTSARSTQLKKAKAVTP